MAAFRATKVDTARGPVKFDEFGNVVGNVYLRKVMRKDGRLVNAVFKTYPDVSQFWTYDKEPSSEPRFIRGTFRRPNIWRSRALRFSLHADKRQIDEP